MEGVPSATTVVHVYFVNPVMKICKIQQTSELHMHPQDEMKVTDLTVTTSYKG